MNRISSIAATVAAFGIGLAALPAAAQYASAIVSPKIIKMGTHTSPVAGNGTVQVQVLVNANGSHTVTRIIYSTNHGDDAAAKELAASSTYQPATRGGKPTAYYYDPIFRFTGGTVANVGSIEGTTSSSTGTQTALSGDDRIVQMIRSGQYDNAKSAVQTALASKPNDPHLLQLLGVIDYYQHDYTDSADSFDKSGTVPKIYAQVAAQAYATAAVHISDTNPTLALTYAQKATAVDQGAYSRFALGVAQLANKQYSDAITTLQGVHTSVFADPHSDTDTRYGVDQRLIQAYVASEQLNQAQATAAEMRRLEPSNTFPTEMLGEYYITLGQTDHEAKKDDQAIAAYQQAAALDDPKIQVAAYDRVANIIANESKPDPATLKGYADKALAIDANDPVANFFEGFAIAEQYNASHDQRQKAQALTYLNKADTLAKAAGEQALAKNIEQIIQSINTTTQNGSSY